VPIVVEGIPTYTGKNYLKSLRQFFLLLDERKEDIHMLRDYRDIRAELEQGDWIGDVKFFDGVRIRVAPGGHVEIRDYTAINSGTQIHCKKKVIIGSHILIGWDVTIMDTDYHGIGNNPCGTEPVILEDGVWVANGVTITKGVTIGRGAVVAAGSVIAKDILPFTIVGGNPARKIKEIEPFEGRHGQLYEPKWYDPSFIPKPLPEDV
jgi:acetyltransferase-like isoleucine patch superfamily enzyme